MFHPSLHLPALVCDDFPSGRFEGGHLALHWSQCLLDVIIHPSDVAHCCSPLDYLSVLCPVLIGAARGNALDLAPGSPESLQVLLGG